MLLVVKLSKYVKKSNYDSAEVLERLHTKTLFKNLCKELKVNVPEEISTNTIDSLFSFPVIVKPLNLSGGRGISVANNINELTYSIRNAQEESNNKNVLIEEFINSNLYAYSVIFQNQKIVYSFMAQELEKSYYVTTTFGINLEDKLVKILDHDLEKIAKFLMLKDGLLHVQFMIKNNIANILEVTRRIPGDLFPTLIELSDGVEYSKAIVNSYLGKTNNIKQLLLKNKNLKLIRYCVLSSKECIFDDIFIDKNIKVMKQVNIYDKNKLIKANVLVSIVIIVFEKNIIDNIDKLIYVRGKQ